jgi:hypothetical protein
MLEMSGRHGQGIVKAKGEMEWSQSARGMRLEASAEDLPLDDSLYQSVPADWRQGWDAVKPQGTVDATLKLGGGEPFTMTLKPRKLAITPQALPYQLTDVGGTVTLTQNLVHLEDVHGRHGDR